MRLSALSPTIVALLAVGCGSRLAAADDASTARDAEFEAVRQLIDHEIQAPAARQLKLFLAANYPGADWYQKYLDWDFSDRFHDLEAAKVEAMAKEISEASKSGSLPPVVQAAFKGGGGTMWRMVQELAQVMGPDITPDAVGASNLAASERDRRNRLLKGIIAACDVEWNEALDKVKANAEAETKLQDMDEHNPSFQPETYKACNLRYDAVHVLWKAHVVLREAITRGKDFGVDPQPAIDYLSKVLSYQKDGPSDLGKWDYDWGLDYMPLKADVNEMLGEALRLKVGAVNMDDIETSFFQVFDYELKQFKPNVRDQFVELQLRTWASMLRWHLELGDDANLKRAIDDFNNLQERLKGTAAINLNGSDARAIALAQCYLVAARIQGKLHNTTACNSLLGKVAGARQNPESGNAGMWLLYLTHGGGGGDPHVVGGDEEWGQAPEADDPSQAVDTASAFLAQALETDDAKQARGLFTHAAVALRNGILGLSDGYEDQFIAEAPIIYERYAYALYKLDMHFHAAIAAEEGLRAIAARITAKESPWRMGKDPKRALTEEGKPLEKLCKNATTYASMLRQRARKSQVVESVHGDVLELALKILPETQSVDKEWSKAYDDYQSGEFEKCKDDVRALLKADRTDANFYKGFALITSALMGEYEKAKSSGDADAMQKAADELTTDSDKIIAMLKDRPKLTSDEQKAYTTAISTPVFINFNAKKYDDVIAALDAKFWKAAPPDEDLRARMLNYLCMSALSLQRARVDDQGKGEDAKAILEQFPKQQAIYATFQRQASRLKDEAADRVAAGGKAMAATFNSVQKAATALILGGDAAADKLKPLIMESRKALADLLYDTLGLKSKPDNVLAVAGLLWEMQDHERGAALYKIYLKQIAKDAKAQDFKRNPKPVLDQVEGVVTQRPELRADWKLIRDLCEDGPGVDDWRDSKIERSQLTEEPIDYARAVERLRAYIATIDQMRSILGEQSWQQMHAQLDPLLAMAVGLAQEIQAMKRVAQYDRESGNGPEARAFYDKLGRYDPDDPDTAVAQVDTVLEDLKGGREVPKEQIEHARSVAAKIRGSEGDNNPRMFWTSQIQVLELSIALNDMANVNDALKALGNHGDVSNDLVSPPVHGDAKIRGDDKRMRRPANAEAIALAQRYLALYKAKGVTVLPSFEVRDIDVDGKTVTVFVDAGAPKLVGHSVENDAGDPVVEFLPEGVDPMADPKPAAPPAQGASSATAGQVAPAPQQGAHP